MAARTQVDPNRYGSLVFCDTCANLLDVPGDDSELVCVQCGDVKDARGALVCCVLFSCDRLPRDLEAGPSQGQFMSLLR
jgi:hypothetical protein